MKWLQHPYFTKGLHVLIWLLLLAVPALLVDGRDFFHLPPNYFLYSNLFHIALFYFNAYWLYPKLMTRRRWPLYPLALIMLVSLSYRIKIVLIGLYPAYPVNDQNQSIVFFPVIPFLIASIIYRLVVDRIAQDRKEKELKTERLDSELNPSPMSSGKSPAYRLCIRQFFKEEISNHIGEDIHHPASCNVYRW